MEIRQKAVLEAVIYADDLEVASDFYASVLNLPLVHGDRRMKVHLVTDQNFLLLFDAGTDGQAIELEGGTIPADCVEKLFAATANFGNVGNRSPTS